MLPLTSVRHIVRRDLTGGSGRYIALPLEGHEVLFKLDVDTTIFPGGRLPKVTEIRADGKKIIHPVDNTRFFIGTAEGKSESFARFHVDDKGILTGSLLLEKKEFHVEPGRMYTGNTSDDFMIIYAANQLSWPDRDGKSKRNSKSNAPHFCGTEDSGYESLASSPMYDKKFRQRNDTNEKTIGGKNRRTAGVHTNSVKNTCLVHTVADYSFFAAHGGVTDSDLGIRNVRDAILTAIGEANNRLSAVPITAQHNGVDIFASDQVHIAVKEIEIYTSESNDFLNPTTSPLSKSTESSGSVCYHGDTILGKFRSTVTPAGGSPSDIARQACITHLFTDLDMCGGIIGKAHTNSACRGWGGCDTSTTCNPFSTEGINAGVTSWKNWGSRVPLPQWKLVTTHEIGHNFGMNHDSLSRGCTPAEISSPHIMNAASVDGSAASNWEFSSCSKTALNSYIQSYWTLRFLKQWDGTSHTSTTVAHDVCLVPYTGARCGDFIVQPNGQDGRSGTLQEDEDDEECDAGDEGDACCTGSAPSSGKPCRWIGGATCTPTASPCCTSCQISFAFENKVCFVAYTGSCSATSHCLGSEYCGCTGGTSTTPCLNSQPDLTACITPSSTTSGSGICQSGICTDVCTYAGAIPCSCTGDQCVDCCTGGSFGSSCSPANEAPSPINGLRNHYKSAGMACSDGICNDAGICVIPASDAVGNVLGLDFLSTDQVGVWARNNIVGAAVVFIGIPWIIAGALMCRRDRMKRRKIQSEMFLYATGFGAGVQFLEHSQSSMEVTTAP